MDKHTASLAFIDEEGKRKDVALIKLLLEHGADANPMGNFIISRTLQHHGDRAYEIVELLLTYGADINTPLSALYTAIKYVDKLGIRTIELLLEHGANVTADVFQSAIEYGDLEVLELLRQHSVNAKSQIESDPSVP